MSDRPSAEERARELWTAFYDRMHSTAGSKSHLIGMLQVALEAHAAGWKESAKDFRDACDLLTEERDRERARADAAEQVNRDASVLLEQANKRVDAAEAKVAGFESCNRARQAAEARVAELERHLGSLERLNGVNAQFGAAGIADMQRQRDDALARADALERELDEANEREQVASSCFAEARADLQQARQQIIREHTDSRYAAGWRAGRDSAADKCHELAELYDKGPIPSPVATSACGAALECEKAIRALEPGGDS